MVFKDKQPASAMHETGYRRTDGRIVADYVGSSTGLTAAARFPRRRLGIKETKSAGKRVFRLDREVRFTIQEELDVLEKS
jgi:hypothetical protein